VAELNTSGSGEALVPVAGAEVCVFESPQPFCAITDQNGVFTLKGLPDASGYVLSSTKSGYQSNLRLAFPWQTLSPTTLYTDAQAEAIAAAVGGVYPDNTTGHILFGAGTSGSQGEAVMVEGFTASLAPPSGLGPFYANAGNQIEPGLTASTSAGWGAFFNVAPGDYQVLFSHPTLSCGEPVGARVVGGYVTSHIAAACQ
jgi:hypothetical protein